MSYVPTNLTVRTWSTSIRSSLAIPVRLRSHRFGRWSAVQPGII
jgi:hypothetical protein